ncbi:hypothetical protein V1477_018838 [Vespula maculifrons]|uniref:Uncharacterized protein n=1 Tax=Vespula maculifrons TaxID=7453 RepID=A0ABD2AWH6_VESMC
MPTPIVRRRTAVSSEQVRIKPEESDVSWKPLDDVTGFSDRDAHASRRNSRLRDRRLTLSDSSSPFSDNHHTAPATNLVNFDAQIIHSFKRTIKS